MLTPSDPTALEGTYRVFASLLLEDEDVYHVQLRWGTIDESPAGNVNDEVLLDSGDTSNMPNPADVNLGVVRFDRASSSLVLELWGRRDTVGSQITWTDVWLLPVDEASLNATSPGFRFGRFGREVYTGHELTRAGGASLDDDDRVVLNGTNEYSQTEDVNLPVGTHMVSFIGTVVNFGKVRQEVGRLEVFENDAVDAGRRALLTSRRKYTRIHYDHDNPKQVAWKVTSTSDDYRWRVTQTVDNTNNRAIKIARLIHSFIPTVRSNRQFVIDGIEREAYIADTNGSRFFPLHVSGAFMTLEPGTNVLVFRLGDVSTRSVYREADSRAKLSEMIASRTGTATVEVRERFIV